MASLREATDGQPSQRYPMDARLLGMPTDRDVVVVLLPRGHPLLRALVTTAGRSVTIEPPNDDTRPVSSTDGLTIERDRRVVRWNGDPLPLSQREFEIVDRLARPGHPAVGFDDLVRTAWQTSYVGRDVVHHAIKRLRRKLERLGVPLRIESAPGFGFRIADDVHANAPARR
jgi:DNA-binding response OmpR family regulator